MPNSTPTTTEAANGDRHGLPVIESCQRVRTVGGEQRRRIGADREEGDETEIEKSGEPHLEIETHPHQDVEPDQHHHLADVGAGDDRKQHQQQDATGRRAQRRHSPAGPRRNERGDPGQAPGALRPQQRAAGCDAKIADCADGAESLPSIDRLAHGADERAELHHDLDEFLKDAEDRHEGEADETRFAHPRRRQRERGAEPGQHCRSEDQENRTGRDAEAEGQLPMHSRRKRDEDRAKVETASPRSSNARSCPCDGAGEKARQGERPEFGGLSCARATAAPAPSATANQRGVAERHDVDDDPARCRTTARCRRRVM